MFYQNKDWLIQQFSVPQTSIEDVANLAGCHKSTIVRWLRFYGLKARSASELHSKRQAQSNLLNPLIYEIIDGELLGDGSLQSCSIYSARYTHGSKYKDYLIWLFERLDFYGLSYSKKINTRNNKGVISYQTQTLSHVELASLKTKWYPFGRKVVPDNLVLTPTKCLHWYLGDGWLDEKRVVLCTYGFTLNNIQMLLTQLNSLGDFNITLRNPRRTHNPQKSRGCGYSLSLNSSFLDFIGNCPKEIEQIYGYKWNVSRRVYVSKSKIKT